jgi:hypothetical protein
MTFSKPLALSSSAAAATVPTTAAAIATMAAFAPLSATAMGSMGSMGQGVKIAIIGTGVRPELCEGFKVRQYNDCAPMMSPDLFMAVDVHGQGSEVFEILRQIVPAAEFIIVKAFDGVAGGRLTKAGRGMGLSFNAAAGLSLLLFAMNVVGGLIVRLVIHRR